jgi:hypothetical protein
MQKSRRQNETAHANSLSAVTKNGFMKPNKPMQQIAIPAGLLSCLLLIPLRGQEPRQKRVAIPDRGRSATIISLPL